ncbi:hypothetical protein Tco_0403817 [Tanacetum coccineum]
MGNGDDVFLGDAPIIVLREYVSQDLAEKMMNSVRMPRYAGKTYVITAENISALTYGLLGAFLQTHGGSDILRTFLRDTTLFYKFKEGDFPRHRIQDIEDMLLSSRTRKLTTPHFEERIAFNVSLRMFSRSVESYQKKLNLTKPDTYRSNLRRKDAYTPYSDPRGFIYENKDKKNRLMRIDELHKFSDGTLDDVVR